MKDFLDILIESNSLDESKLSNAFKKAGAMGLLGLSLAGIPHNISAQETNSNRTENSQESARESFKRNYNNRKVPKRFKEVAQETLKINKDAGKLLLSIFERYEKLGDLDMDEINQLNYDTGRVDWILANDINDPDGQAMVSKFIKEDMLNLISRAWTDSINLY
jgi:hypothetical protein